ncbi:MAG: extracellular solute-binding protein [Oscillospiraceae bacterium]|jgi:multiple sugar transport system substrate-binding protein|nr:extracellular solute-binding protein [Oscillospiraceae bacterium]
MKKLLALLLAMTMVMALVACGNNSNQKPAENTPPAPAENQEPAAPAENEPAAPAATSEITLWTYPIGDWGDEATVKKLTDAFTAETGIAVKVEYLAYADGDDKVNTAITAKGTPDLIMEGPERLVANWGANGYLVDLKDMFDDTDMSEINAVNEGVMNACTHTNGAIYEYPLVMTAHCMAVNVNAFKEAGADQYLHLDTHTWTTDEFINAVAALYAHYNDTVGAVYCAGQGGDQGTRALVNNLYGGAFTNAEHTQYTWDDPLNIQALEQLKSMDGIAFDASLAGGDEIAKFYQGALKMAFCWNIAQQLDPNGAKTGAEKTVTGDDIAFMSFPSQDGNSKLQGGIWGFGIFDNGDQARIDAAKQFIKYMCDSAHTVDAVKAARYFAVRTTAEGTDLTGIWADNAIMNEYTKLMPYLGDYYQVTTGWAGARTEWWNMLQEVGAGQDITASVAAHAATANSAAG